MIYLEPNVRMNLLENFKTRGNATVTQWLEFRVVVAWDTDLPSPNLTLPRIPTLPGLSTVSRDLQTSPGTCAHTSQRHIF